jgi:branched-chain amino acid transport system substrate-binding protein
VKTATTIAIAALTALALAGGAKADDTFKVGSSVGLTGYAAAPDTAWRDGLLLAVEAINAEGGIAGKKVEAFVEDNHSQPQDAVIGYKKMIDEDKVSALISGCVSAGTFAIAPTLVKEHIPLLACTIPPQVPEQRPWVYEIRPDSSFGLDMLIAYAKDKRGIKKIGVLHDQTPYSNIQTTIIQKKLAPQHGVEIVVDSYGQNDADMSVQINRLASAGAGAIIKIGDGPTTITVAKNMKQLGLKIPLIVEDDDSGVWKQAADQLGDRFLMGADPTQVYHYLPAGAARNAVTSFMKRWEAKYPGRDAYAAAYSWDSLHLVKAAVEAGKAVDGQSIRDNLEKIKGYQGVGGVYGFTPDNHWGINENTYIMSVFKNGHIVPIAQ